MRYCPDRMMSSSRGLWFISWLLLVSAGCGDNRVQLAPDAAPDSPPDAPPSDAIVDIRVSPLTLTPAFSPDVHDYTVPCAAGDNPVAIDVVDGAGTHSTTEMLAEDQLYSIRDQYFVRCLPHDFPPITVTTYPQNGEPTPGWYLLSNTPYAVVVDTHGTPVWYRWYVNPVGVDSQKPNTISFIAKDEPFLILGLDGTSNGTLMTSDNSVDNHELRFLPNGNYLLLADPVWTHVDLTGLKSYGNDETMMGCEIEELTPDGTLVWSWFATDHIDPVTESITPGTITIGGVPMVDPYHCNAIDVDAAGNLLLSVRHASAAYYIDRSTGTVRWKLGGTATNKDGAKTIAVMYDPETTFSRQHDVRFLDATHVTMFDNHGNGPPGFARGIEYALNIAAGTAVPVFQYLGSGQSQYTGSFRRFADSHSVVGWGFIAGDQRVLTEVDANARPVLEISLPNSSYRSLKVDATQLDIGLMRASAGRAAPP